MSDVSLPEDELAPLPRTAAYRRSFPTLRTVAALVLREMSTRYGRTPGGFLWALLQPLATVLILGFAFSLLARLTEWLSAPEQARAAGAAGAAVVAANRGALARHLKLVSRLLTEPPAA